MGFSLLTKSLAQGREFDTERSALLIDCQVS
jgi:hypothetical protein